MIIEIIKLNFERMVDIFTEKKEKIPLGGVETFIL